MSGWQIVALVAVVLAWLVAFRFVGVLEKKADLAHRSVVEVLTGRKPFDQEQQ